MANVSICFYYFGVWNDAIFFQVLGKVPTISVDKTDGCMIYLSKDSLATQLVTAKSSAMNVLVPDASGDFVSRYFLHSFCFSVHIKRLFISCIKIDGLLQWVRHPKTQQRSCGAILLWLRSYLPSCFHVTHLKKINLSPIRQSRKYNIFQDLSILWIAAPSLAWCRFVGRSYTLRRGYGNEWCIEYSRVYYVNTFLCILHCLWAICTSVTNGNRNTGWHLCEQGFWPCIVSPSDNFWAADAIA